MLFNYKSCDTCHRCGNAEKVLLYQIFPATICNKINEFNNMYCSRCEWMRVKEVEFLAKPLPSYLSDLELQLLFFKAYKKAPITLYAFDYIDTQKFKQQLQEMLNHEEFEKQYNGNKYFLQAIKSWSKKKSYILHKILLQCFSKKAIRSLKDSGFLHMLDDKMTYRRKEFQIKQFVEAIIKEYVSLLVGTDKDYCNHKLWDYVHHLFDFQTIVISKF